MIPDLRPTPALVALCAISMLVAFPYLRSRSDFELLDDVIKNAGLERKDVIVFDDILEFRQSSATDGVVLDNGRIVALRLIGSDFNNFSLLKRLDGLITLNLYGNRLTSVEGVESLRKLRYLNVANNSLADFTPVLELGNLKELYIGENSTSMPIRPVGIKSAYHGLESKNGVRGLKFEIEQLMSLHAASESDEAASGGAARRFGPSIQRTVAAFAFVYDFVPGRYQLQVRAKLLDDSETGKYFTLSVLVPTEGKYRTVLRQAVSRSDFVSKGSYEVLVFEWLMETECLNTNVIAYYHPGSEIVLDSAVLTKVDLTGPEESAFDAVLRIAENGTRVYS